MKQLGEKEEGYVAIAAAIFVLFSAMLNATTSAILAATAMLIYAFYKIYGKEKRK